MTTVTLTSHGRIFEYRYSGPIKTLLLVDFADTNETVLALSPKSWKLSVFSLDTTDGADNLRILADRYELQLTAAGGNVRVFHAVEGEICAEGNPFRDLPRELLLRIASVTGENLLSAVPVTEAGLAI